MTVYEKLQQLCKSKGISITSLCLNATGNKGNLSTWKNDNGHMRSDYLSKCADILDCSTDYILGRTNINGDNIMENNNEKLECKSETQRAMLKCRLHNLMMVKYQKECFYSELNEALGVNDSAVWFNLLNDFTLDEKIPDMLRLLGKTDNNLFEEMNVTIQTLAVAQALSLKGHEESNFPIIVSGKDIFKAVSNLSLVALAALQDNLPSQLTHYETILGKQATLSMPEELSLVADSQKSVPAKEDDETTIL